METIFEEPFYFMLLSIYHLPSLHQYASCGGGCSTTIQLQKRKQGKNAKYEQGAIKRTQQVHEYNKKNIHTHQGKCNGTVRHTPVEQQMVYMIAIRAKRRPAVADTDAKYAKGI